MRKSFINTLVSLARQDERVWLLVGDLGFQVVEAFVQEFPDRFLNVGVAEQNMTGVAAGLALSGKIVFTYSIGNFPTLRCLEQVRNDVCYHRANVKVVAVGGGLAYASLGPTHHATEDLAILRSLPELTVIAPGDPMETAEATRWSIAHNGPVYLRLGKVGEPIVHTKMPNFDRAGCFELWCKGSDPAITFVATGSGLALAARLADQMYSEGMPVRLVSCPIIKPLDNTSLLGFARNSSLVVSVEEHSLCGGLGGALAELWVDNRLTIPLLRLGLKNCFIKEAGSQAYLCDQYGLNLQSCLERIRSALAITMSVGS